MKIERPQADKKKIHSKNEFELCYMRHQYLRRVTFNPTEADMQPYQQIISHQAKNTYYTYKNLFMLVGFDVEDLINIARIHLVSFLGLYKLDKSPEKYQNFLEVHLRKKDREANAEDVENKDRANLTLFMKQRMEDVVRVCRQKARNIKGMPVEEFYSYSGPNEPPQETIELLEEHQKYGFKKIDNAYYKSVKKRHKKLQQEMKIIEVVDDRYKPFIFAGTWFVAVPLDKRNLTLLDFAGAGYDPYDSIHNRNPEELFIIQQSEDEFEAKKAEFESSSDRRKENRIRHFIRKNKGNPMFKEEIEIAKQYLRDLRA